MPLRKSLREGLLLAPSGGLPSASSAPSFRHKISEPFGFSHVSGSQHEIAASPSPRSSGNFTDTRRHSTPTLQDGETDLASDIEPVATDRSMSPTLSTDSRRRSGYSSIPPSTASFVSVPPYIASSQSESRLASRLGSTKRTLSQILTPVNWPNRSSHGKRLGKTPLRVVETHENLISESSRKQADVWIAERNNFTSHAKLERLVGGITGIDRSSSVQERGRSALRHRGHSVVPRLDHVLSYYPHLLDSSMIFDWNRDVPKNTHPNPLACHPTNYTRPEVTAPDHRTNGGRGPPANGKKAGKWLRNKRGAAEKTPRFHMARANDTGGRYRLSMIQSGHSKADTPNPIKDSRPSLSALPRFIPLTSGPSTRGVATSEREQDGYDLQRLQTATPRSFSSVTTASNAESPEAMTFGSTSACDSLDSINDASPMQVPSKRSKSTDLRGRFHQRTYSLPAMHFKDYSSMEKDLSLSNSPKMQCDMSVELTPRAECPVCNTTDLLLSDEPPRQWITRALATDLTTTDLS